jgi:hypothetical protein
VFFANRDSRFSTSTLSNRSTLASGDRQLFLLRGDKIQRRRGLIGTDGFVRLVDDARMARSGKKEGMVVKLVPILHSNAVDLGSDPTRVNKGPGIGGQPLAAVTDFGWGLS